MPLWDSVQRNLEKASQEAARMSKVQRVRANIDGLSHQIYAQTNQVVNKTMELFTAGQITNSELLMVCQELANLHQQVNQAQIELQQLQKSQPQAPQLEMPTSYPSPDTVYYPPTPGEGSPTAYAPPPPAYYPYSDPGTGSSATAPPPPPNVEPHTASSMNTSEMLPGLPPPPPALGTEKRFCPACQSELYPHYAFCRNCGSPVQDSGSINAPTLPAERSAPNTGTPFPQTSPPLKDKGV